MTVIASASVRGEQRRSLACSALVFLVAGALATPSTPSFASARHRTAEHRAAFENGSASSGHTRYVVALTGSAHYLIYAQASTHEGRHAIASVFARGAKGHVKRLGEVNLFHASDFKVHGDLVTYTNGPAGKFYEWNIKTATKNAVPYEGDIDIVGVLSGGDLLEVSGGSDPEVMRVSKGGKETSLGTPFPSGETFGITYGGGVYVAADWGDEDPGGIVVGSLTPPASTHSIYADSGEPDPAGQCSAPSGSYVACTLTNTPESMRIYRLSGKLVASASGQCSDDRVILPAKAAFWQGCGGAARYIWQLDPSGAVSHSSRNYSSTQLPVAALRQVVVANPARTQLIGLSSVGATPRVLASRD
jgi:hypothetical protein